MILSGKLCTIVFSPEAELSILIQNIDTNLRDYNHNICLESPQNFNSIAFVRKLKLRVLTTFFENAISYVVLWVMTPSGLEGG